MLTNTRTRRVAVGLVGGLAMLTFASPTAMAEDPPPPPPGPAESVFGMKVSEDIRKPVVGTVTDGEQMERIECRIGHDPVELEPLLTGEKDDGTTVQVAPIRQSLRSGDLVVCRTNVDPVQAPAYEVAVTSGSGGRYGVAALMSEVLVPNEGAFGGPAQVVRPDEVNNATKRLRGFEESVASAATIRGTDDVAPDVVIMDQGEQPPAGDFGQPGDDFVPDVTMDGDEEVGRVPPAPRSAIRNDVVDTSVETLMLPGGDEDYLPSADKESTDSEDSGGIGFGTILLILLLVGGVGGGGYYGYKKFLAGPSDGEDDDDDDDEFDDSDYDDDGFPMDDDDGFAGFDGGMVQDDSDFHRQRPTDDDFPGGGTDDGIGRLEL